MAIDVEPEIGENGHAAVPWAGGRVEELAVVRDGVSGFTLKLLVWRNGGTSRFRMCVVSPNGMEGAWTEWTSWHDTPKVE